MTAVPLQNYVLCEQISGFKEESEDKGVLVKKETMKEYRILSISESLDDSRYLVGDVIICNSTGTRFILEDKEMYLFNIENIAGKVEG